MRRTPTLPTSKHFQLEHIAEGVYAAFATVGGAAFSNAGIIDLGDRTLIFDTFETPLAADDLRAAAERLTGRPATYVVISHSHFDHWLGNQAFADATIIATHSAREQMVTGAEQIERLRQDPSELEEALRQDRERLKGETDERRRADLEHSIARWQHALASFPTLDLRFPDQTFERRLLFHGHFQGTQRAAELLALEAGHTGGDCFLALPAERVVFMGDMGFFYRQPFMPPNSDSHAWVAHLEEMERSDFETFVPGHGPLGTKAEITLQKQYITTLEALVAQVIGEGGSVEEALRRPLPAPFDAWSAERTPVEANVRTLYERLSGQGGQ